MTTEEVFSSVPQRLIDTVSAYHRTYRHPNLRPLEVSGLYALFPNEPSAVTAQFSWSKGHPWPGAENPGVYLIFDAAMDLRYIGRADPLGRRLAEYFKYEANEGSSCRVYHPGWKKRPTFVATISVGKSFEAGALEEYLIQELGPAENARGMLAR